jgi:hypothetical protein
MRTKYAKWIISWDGPNGFRAMKASGTCATYHKTYGEAVKRVKAELAKAGAS